MDEEIELKKKIALYYHPMVSIKSPLSIFMLNSFILIHIVSKLPLIVVCTPAIRELLEIEQTAIHGVERAHSEKSYSRLRFGQRQVECA